ncbi:MAG: transcription termination/antitermination protein NusG, partial [Treponema sp.]|nr:transcription termination/antitermination protein NusG [Treponema sp.]
MAKSWYIIHTFTGYEQKIERTLRDMLERGQLDSNVVCDVKVPSEEVVEIRNNKKYVKRNKILPSYIMLEMDLPQVGWKPVCNAIRHIQGVTGF